MALVSCTGCGNELSSKADSCPRCGTKIVRKPMGCGTLAGIAVFVTLLILAYVYLHSAQPG
jgi:DNA-directed RNA polymerase subunit RPC12/RpoP